VRSSRGARRGIVAGGIVAGEGVALARVVLDGTPAGMRQWHLAELNVARAVAALDVAGSRAMTRSRPFAAWLQQLWLLGSLVLGWGCAEAPRRILYPLSGDEFTLFPGETKAPPPITCSGETGERFACFTRELVQRGRGLDVAGSFAVAEPDGKIRSFTRGDELNAQPPITEDTQFPAASVSKMFLGAAAVSLSLEGSVDLQQPISHYLPELTQEGVGQATLHQLLTHTSGLLEAPACDKETDDLKDVLAKYGNSRLWSPPGAVSRYSNLGYSFVALVLERVAGKPFEQVVRERVLVPAGIPGAHFGFERLAVRGHAPDGAKLEPRCRAMWPAGGLVLSVRELATWGHELAHPDASKLGRPLLERLTAPYVQAGGRPGASYGYGVGRLEHGGLPIFAHAGRLSDFSSMLVWSPDRHWAVAAFADTGADVVQQVALRAMSTFLSLPEDWQPPPGPAHALNAYVGDYVDRAGTLGHLRVSLEGEQLVIDYLDGPPPLLSPAFRFVLEPGASLAHYVVTPIGVGERAPASGVQVLDPPK
jgi:CubicO group peptidase (beta-lactamase class C family)